MRQKNKLKPLIPHLKLMNSSSAAPNIHVSANDSNANKLFELLIALLCLRFSDDVSLDHPESSEGDNPDVLVKINDKVWGFACKVLHGNSALTFYERLEEGIDQIECSNAERGIVIFNFKNIINHDVFCPILNQKDIEHGAEPLYGKFKNINCAHHLLCEFMKKKHHELHEENGHDNIVRLFNGKKTEPGILILMQTSVCHPENGAFSSFGFFGYLDALGVGSKFDDVLELLNKSMQNI